MSIEENIRGIELKALIAKKNRKNIIRYLIYFAVLLLSVSINITLAKYTTSFSGDDTARVATYNVSVTCLDSVVETNNGGIVVLSASATQEYRFQITNENSEIDVSVSVDVVSVSGYNLVTYSLYDLGTSSTGTGTLVSSLPFTFDLDIDEYKYIRIVITGNSSINQFEGMQLDIDAEQREPA